MCVYIVSKNMSETFHLPRRIFRMTLDIIINVYLYSCKVTVIIVRFRRNSNLFERFSKKKPLKREISWKSIQWEGSCCMRADGRQTSRI